jgi:hypothetical protein
MAHFAQLEGDTVINVIVVDNGILLNGEGVEVEQLGADFCADLLGNDYAFVQTSYSGSFRKRYAIVGGTYNRELDAFIPPRPYRSWVLNTESCLWEPPVPYPNDERVYIWDELAVSWVEEVGA